MSSQVLTPDGPSKGTLTLVHLYPREMSIYGDRGNTHALASRIRRHGYSVEVVLHDPGDPFRADAHLVLGGGGQDSGQARVEADLEAIGPSLKAMARDGVPMLVICGMYQLFGDSFHTVTGQVLPGLSILEVTTRGNDKRMIGPVCLETDLGRVVGYENHSGSTVLGPGQQPFGRVLAGHGNNGEDGTEGARTANVIGSYLHGPLLPANPMVSDALIAVAAEQATGRPFEPAQLADPLATQARERQVRRLLRAR
ncbi:cobalamin biosynthesis protein CobB [Phycicoccus endophyticus]|uniref:Lipid II isoglutaminyl synthase (glutamine-hydrolyzing) subunit GatD n=1 Tax=Phycicoccus endophyticus TaxID=1690220 RepID=A0A7G9R2N1_9MICO|nr:cobalamin biosynthesis protein CobB [Phycicoccus endophyticus]NHI20679.1 cobalamin biosynthesis protein CobB [Phycicoccus endophyticus]QNN49856.1 cobalamin biosynthesis protein CobB [Phycicoccus endophyticus]GGL35792.1 glutamine amidotransferase [Phycicoccus endophyticus]